MRHLVYARNKRANEHTNRTRKKTARTDAADICKKFNWGKGCDFGHLCRYKHECIMCLENHPAKSCEGKDTSYKRRRAEEGQHIPHKTEREIQNKRDPRNSLP